MNSLRVAVSLAGLLLLAGGSMQRIAEGAEFTLMPSPQTVHIGHFAANLKPVLSINSGDTVTIETSSLLPPEVVDQSGVVPPSAVPQYQRDIFRDVKDRGPGPHVLTGPIRSRARCRATCSKYVCWRSISRSTGGSTASGPIEAPCLMSSL